MSWTIYVITNTVNGKKYVGQTVQTIQRRWRGHIYKIRTNACRALAAAILKHGASNFEIHILDVCETRESANTSEIRWIAELGTIAPGGYNLDSGGTCERIRSEETLALLAKNARAQIYRLTADERSEKDQTS